MYEKFICPLTKKDIVEAVIAPDGITYERSALLKYVRKYKKSPVTGEKMDTSTLVFDENYIGSDENKAEDILNKVRDSKIFAQIGDLTSITRSSEKSYNNESF